MEQLKSQGQREDSLQSSIRNKSESLSKLLSETNFPKSEQGRFDKELTQISKSEDQEAENATLETSGNIVDHQNSIIASLSPQYQEQANYAKNDPFGYAAQYRKQWEERNQMVRAA